jgi:hypothetical protein
MSYFFLLILGCFLCIIVIDINPKTMGLGFVKVDVLIYFLNLKILLFVEKILLFYFFKCRK